MGKGGMVKGGGLVKDDGLAMMVGFVRNGVVGDY